MTTKRLAELSTAIAALLRPYRDQPIPTDALRQAADLIVEARSQMTTRDGLPDWRGTTHQYRVWNGETLTMAGLAGADRARIQAALRYHIGNAIRNRLGSDDLEDLALRVNSPRERSGQHHAKRAELLNLFAGGAPYTNPGTLEEVLHLAWAALGRADIGAISDAIGADEDAGDGVFSALALLAGRVLELGDALQAVR